MTMDITRSQNVNYGCWREFASLQWGWRVVHQVLNVSFHGSEHTPPTPFEQREIETYILNERNICR